MRPCLSVCRGARLRRIEPTVEAPGDAERPGHEYVVAASVNEVRDREALQHLAVFIEGAAWTTSSTEPSANHNVVP